MKQIIAPIITLFLATAVGGVHIWAEVEGRWHSLPLKFISIVSYLCCIAYILIPGLAAIAFKGYRRPLLASMLVAAGVFFTCTITAKPLAKWRRDAEIIKAVDQGLEQDCRTVILSYQDDPDFVEDGYVRIFPGTEAFDSLPSSIRTFVPDYVTIERDPFDLNQPPNVGLCKNGFGGFHMGVRVFEEPPEIPSGPGRQPITPTVYLWIDGT